VAPLRKAADAHALDTTLLTADEILFFAKTIVQDVMDRHRFGLREGVA
jgi:cytidylate kinase